MDTSGSFDTVNIPSTRTTPRTPRPAEPGAGAFYLHVHSAQSPQDHGVESFLQAPGDTFQRSAPPISHCRLANRKIARHRCGRAYSKWYMTRLSCLPLQVPYLCNAPTALTGGDARGGTQNDLRWCKHQFKTSDVGGDIGNADSQGVGIF